MITTTNPDSLLSEQIVNVYQITTVSPYTDLIKELILECDNIENLLTAQKSDYDGYINTLNDQQNSYTVLHSSYQRYFQDGVAFSNSIFEIPYTLEGSGFSNSSIDSLTLFRIGDPIGNQDNLWLPGGFKDSILNMLPTDSTHINRETIAYTALKNKTGHVNDTIKHCEFRASNFEERNNGSTLIYTNTQYHLLDTLNDPKNTLNGPSLPGYTKQAIITSTGNGGNVFYFTTPSYLSIITISFNVTYRNPINFGRRKWSEVSQRVVLYDLYSTETTYQTCPIFYTMDSPNRPSFGYVVPLAESGNMEGHGGVQLQFISGKSYYFTFLHLPQVDQDVPKTNCFSRSNKYASTTLIDTLKHYWYKITNFQVSSVQLV